MKKIILTSLLLILAGNAQAITKEDIKTAVSNKVPDNEIGLMIAKEIDARDNGFDNTEAELTMTLKNAYGEESVRKLRNKTLEIADVSKGDKTLVVFDHPRDIAGTAFLTFSNILEADDQWLFLPALKRVKRISSKNKSGPFMGSEFAYEDISSQEVEKYTYKYLGEDSCGNDKCFKIERFPTYKHSGYTRQIAWIDMERFIPIKMDYYDRKNSLLKTQLFEEYHQYEDKYWRTGNMLMNNHQNGKSTTLRASNYIFRSNLQESDFTKAKLKRLR